MQQVTHQDVGIKEIKTPSDIHFLLHEVGWEYIASIKAHLADMEGCVDFDEPAVREIIGDILPGDRPVQGLSVNEEGEILVYKQFRRSCKLSSMLMDETIKVDELLSILEALIMLRK